jgi:uncharacterized membrane protein HdeD (DUF308 family)
MSSKRWAGVLLIVFMPLIVASAVSVMTRGWAYIVQSGNPSLQTRSRQKQEFKALLVGFYLILISTLIYLHFHKR